jgi:hypothetical protein
MEPQAAAALPATGSSAEGPETILYVYHGAMEDKEFEFTFTVPVPSDDTTSFAAALHAAVTANVEEASSTLLDSVQPVMCVACGATEAIKLQHNLMYFDDVVPRRVEDLPQPLCGGAKCAREAHEAVQRDLKEASRLMAASGKQVKKPKTLSACVGCGAVTEKLMQCGRCKVARYCSGACQKQHWPTHKPFCLPAQAAAA